MSRLRLLLAAPKPNLSRFTSSENLFCNLSSGRLLALTAPLVIDQEVLIGYAESRKEACCANLTLDEFISICNSIYFQVNAPRVFHGLKRIWEFLDGRRLHTETDRDNHIDINKIHDTKLLTYLLSLGYGDDGPVLG
jgi:hypothetical protein